MPETKLKLLLKESLLAMIQNSPGTKMFRNSFFVVNGKKRDILDSGRLSCAIYVSSVLYIFKLIAGVHATVNGTVQDIENSHLWKPVSKPMPGDVLVWETLKFKDGSEHKHIGFCISPDQAVSNSYKLGYPIKHHLTYGVKNGKPVRKIELIYRHTLEAKNR